MDSSINKENDARSSQENTAKRLSVDTSNTSTLQAARPVLQEIETLSNDRVLIEEFGTSFQRDGKEITFVDIQSNITTDLFLSPNASYDPLGTCSQSENIDRNSLAYTGTVEEDLFYSIEYMPETQSNNVTYDTTESSRIFGMSSNADSCSIESFSDTPSLFFEKVKDSSVNLDPRNLNVTFEKAPASCSYLAEEPTSASLLKNSFKIAAENSHDTVMEEVKIVDCVGSEQNAANESSFNKSIREIQDQSEFSEKCEIVENFEVITEDCDMEVQTFNPDCSDNIFNPFQISSDSRDDTVHVDDEIKEEVAQIEVEEDMNINLNKNEAHELENEIRNPDEDEKESLGESNVKCDINKEILAVEIMKGQTEEAEFAACCTALENLNLSSAKQPEESTESAVESKCKSSEELQISKPNSPDHSKSNNSDDALSNEEEAKQHEVLNDTQVDGVNTGHVCKQTEEPPTDNEIAPNQVNTVNKIEDDSNHMPQTNTDITKSSGVITEEPSVFCQIEERVIPTVENDLESKKALEALSQSMSESIDSAESVRVTELDSTEQVLNKTIENFKEPVKTKVHCRPNIRSLRQKTQVIENPLIVKPVPTDNVISESRVKEFKEKELQLKNELDKLQVELTEIQKENEIKDKCILANVLAMEANRDVLAKYKTTVNHYQTFVNKQNSDLLTLRVDTQQLEKDFSNMEMAFADVFNKYEKAKLTIAAFKQNEETLNKNIEGVEKHVDYMDQKCKDLQNKYEQTVKQVQDRVSHERETNQSKLLNLRTSVKRLEIMASSLETALKQKTEECQALAAFCEDIGKI